MDSYSHGRPCRDHREFNDLIVASGYFLILQHSIWKFILLLVGRLKLSINARWRWSRDLLHVWRWCCYLSGQSLVYHSEFIYGNVQVTLNKRKYALDL